MSIPDFIRRGGDLVDWPRFIRTRKDLRYWDHEAYKYASDIESEDYITSEELEDLVPVHITSGTYFEYDPVDGRYTNPEIGDYIAPHILMGKAEAREVPESEIPWSGK